MDHILAAESIGKRFGGREVLRAAGCWAVPGEITVLLGRNGCGKTTLSRIAVGLLRPDTGIVIVGAARYRYPRLATLARQGVYFISQDSSLSPAHTVARHFEALAYHIPDANIGGAIERTGVGSFLSEKPKALSPGERRCVELAIALARRPTCLVADEPFLGLGPSQTQLFGDVFQELANLGAGLWVTGHEVDVLLPLANTVVWMTAGTSHHLGTVHEALTHDQFVREYIGAERLRRLQRNTS